MKKTIVTIISIICFTIASAYSVDEIPNVHVADQTRYLSNPDNIISTAAQVQADSIMGDIWNKTSAEVVAVIVNSIDNRDADDFATELFTKWGVGKKDRNNGVLMLIVNDTHDIVIRTGYGAEGPLPDIVAGRIIRNEMFPPFRRGDYDAGVIAGLSKISDVLTDPAVREELKSEYGNNQRKKREPDSLDNIIASLARWGVALLALMLIVILITSQKAKKQSQAQKYTSYKNLTTGALIATFGGFGIPIIAYFIARYLKSKARNTPPICPRCGKPMRRVSRQQSYTFLNPVRQTEQKIGSMEYDVWRCLNDGENTVIAYPGSNSYTTCPQCGAKACSVSSRQIIHHPTRYRSGEGIETTTCRHCGNMTQRKYWIAKLATPVATGGRGNGFGRGGFGGGSFGGGMTGGGGASGRW